MEIVKIFSNISSYSAQKRINYIDHIKKNMVKIDKQVKDQDMKIKVEAKKLRE